MFGFGPGRISFNVAGGRFEACGGDGVKRLLATLRDAGMDHVKLGQPASTLSGGEAQRVKLSRELGRTDTGRTLYILDEPTTGLHFDDLRKLVAVRTGLALGASLVFVANLVRIVSLYSVRRAQSPRFEAMHEEWWRALLILGAVMAWWAWMSWARGRAAEAHAWPRRFSQACRPGNASSIERPVAGMDPECEL